MSIATLRAISKDPSYSPRSIVLAGSYGTGKTSAARLFPKVMNCKESTGDCCNKCPMCKSIDSGLSDLYLEMDTAIVGKVDNMREVRDSFSYSVSDGYRVVVFNEIHLASQAAQSELLSVLEESPKKIFYVFTTTEYEKILPTILSRSLILEFYPASDTDVEALLKEVADKEGMAISSLAVGRIVRRVGGHIRDALVHLDRIRLIGEDEYLQCSVTTDEDISLFFRLISEDKGASDRVDQVARRLVSNPVKHLEQDFEHYMMEQARKIFVDKWTKDGKMRMVLTSWITHHNLLRTTTDWYVYLLSLEEFFHESARTSASSALFTRRD